MEIKIIRAKEGIAIPSNPENKDSVSTFVQKGMIALVPSDYKIDKEKYDLVQKFKLKKED